MATTHQLIINSSHRHHHNINNLHHRIDQIMLTNFKLKRSLHREQMQYSSNQPLSLLKDQVIMVLQSHLTMQHRGQYLTHLKNLTNSWQHRRFSQLSSKSSNCSNKKILLRQILRAVVRMERDLGTIFN